MIKKYLVDRNSLFHKSLILSLFEPGKLGFILDGLSNEDQRLLFPLNKIKTIKNEVDIKSIPTSIVVIYLDENLLLKAVVLLGSNKKYYLFKIDHQKPQQLNIHHKYISDNLSLLLDDYEKHCKSKGKSFYDGVGDFNKIKDLDYFENVYQKECDKHLNKKSKVYRLTFNNNNMFVVDFVSLVENHKITIINNKLLDKKIFTLQSMEKNKSDRLDSLLIDSESKDIKYLIFTYKPYFVKHYLLLKNLSNNQFEFIKETICFNEIFLCEGIKELTYKNASSFATRSFAKMHYENFYLEYISFELEEQFDEEVQNELIVEPVIDVKATFRNELIKESLNIVKERKMPLDIGVTLHGKERILERIGKMNDEEMLSIVKVAYENGKTSAHFIETNPTMFKFLQYQQNKKLGKTLRFYKDILFFFSLEPPHDLVTCFLYQSNYEQYVETSDKKAKKKKKAGS